MARTQMARAVVVSALACAAPLVAPGAAAPARGEDAGRARLLAVAREIMQKARYCALVTNGPDGQPQARVVDPQAPEPDLTVWIGTHPATHRDGSRQAPRPGPSPPPKTAPAE